MSDDDEIEPAEDSATPAKGRKLKSPKNALVEACLEADTALVDRRKLLRARAAAIEVTVPGPGWVRPTSAYLGQLIEAEKFERDDSQKGKDAQFGNDDVAAALARGSNVLGISHAPNRLLPSMLRLAADIRIVIRHPAPTTIVRALRLCLRGRPPKVVPEDLGTALDFPELISAMRAGSTPAEAIGRMQAMTHARLKSSAEGKKLPHLGDATFYGAAQEWGMALAADVDSIRRGETGWQDASTRAIFFGPPGTGKTYLAAMIASVTNLPLIEASVADLFASSPGYLDSVIKAQRVVFARASAAAPCVLFWDELDSLPNRATLSPRARDWWMPVVDDFLIQVAAMPRNVVLLGATNLLDHIDAALLRPGRFERAIEIKPPRTAEDLAQIMRFHLGEDLKSDDVVPLARLGLGATAAMAMDWVREAKRTARVAKRPMIVDDLREAVAPPDKRSKDTLERHALHEAGHAVVALVLGLGGLAHLSLVSDGETGGHFRIGHLSERMFSDRESVERFAVLMLAGRAAEIVFYGSASAGAGGSENSDLAKATRLVSGLHFSLGLAGSLVYRGPVGDCENVLRFDPELRNAVEQELRQLAGTAEKIIRDHGYATQCIADELVARRFMTGAEVERVFAAAEEEAKRTAFAQQTRQERTDP